MSNLKHNTLSQVVRRTIESVASDLYVQWSCLRHMFSGVDRYDLWQAMEQDAKGFQEETRVQIWGTASLLALSDPDWCPDRMCLQNHEDQPAVIEYLLNRVEREMGLLIFPKTWRKAGVVSDGDGDSDL